MGKNPNATDRSIAAKIIRRIGVDVPADIEQDIVWCLFAAREKAFELGHIEGFYAGRASIRKVMSEEMSDEPNGGQT